MQRCLNDSELQAAADVAVAASRRHAPVPPAWREHLDFCPRCRAEVEARRAVATALAALGRAERGAVDPSRTWMALATALERPALAHRLPLGWAAATRLAGDLARPAFAASVVAVAAGVGLGTWLAVTTARGLEAAPVADVLDDSNLAAAARGGFEAGWLAGVDADVSNETTPAIADDTTSGVPSSNTRGARPAPSDTDAPAGTP
jgi:hypothetical protein